MYDPFTYMRPVPLSDFKPVQKLVVFAHHGEVLKGLAQAMDEASIRYMRYVFVKYMGHVCIPMTP